MVLGLSEPSTGCMSQQSKRLECTLCAVACHVCSIAADLPVSQECSRVSQLSRQLGCTLHTAWAVVLWGSGLPHTPCLTRLAAEPLPLAAQRLLHRHHHEKLGHFMNHEASNWLFCICSLFAVASHASACEESICPGDGHFPWPVCMGAPIVKLAASTGARSGGHHPR